VRLDGLVAEASLSRLGLLREAVGDQATEVQSVTMDSRAVGPGALFACVVGASSDGHDFAPVAVSAGATALLCERRLDLSVPQIVVTSTRPALALVADALYGHPSHDLTIAGVTGTNGKTTTCAFLDTIFQANGWASTTIGTLTQTRTTPEAPELQAMLAEWRDSGGDAVAMEVSSHALAQHRADAVRFQAAVFTNLTREHLDYHRTMDDYFEAKADLFEPERTGLAIINESDEWGRVLIDRLRGGPIAVETFAETDATDVELTPSSSRFRWHGRHVTIQVGGGFNVTNAVAAAACARALGVDGDRIVDGLAGLTGVPGRFERVDVGQPFTVLVDYAHTPDGLTQVLRAARQLTSGHLLVVFGAGGDRDHDKRPLMGAAAADMADLAILTSDNPRSEDPDAIIEEVRAGAPDRANLQIQSDRAEAIATALATAQPGDVVVIAGKGHEQGQEISGRILPFDDVEVATAALHRIQASRRPAD
jgi:UDP-N-acetylmuramoyl-L-alanyl-D-glutamate--2,6-diaminopimelate ligase